MISFTSTRERVAHRQQAIDGIATGRPRRTSEPSAFSAESYGPSIGSLEFRRLHVVGISSETRIAPAKIYRIFARAAQPPRALR